jgi:acetyl-CoA carboxylase biotin carboxyl carrier protein
MPQMAALHHSAFPPSSAAPNMHGTPDSHPHVTAPSAPVKAGATADHKGRILKSPFVGTFYRSSAPGSDPFTDIGKRVKKGDTLCIIEAMKLMNEITSEYDGEIASVYVDNGKPVQYGERLFAIRTV